MLDGNDLGEAFKTDKIKTDNIYPCIYLHSVFDKVQILNGSVHYPKGYKQESDFIDLSLS